MSFLVRLPEETYRSDALARFTANPDFTLGNAQAMMWLAQLAYETDDPEKIKRILRRFGLEFLDFGTNELIPGSFRPKGCFIVARLDHCAKEPRRSRRGSAGLGREHPWKNQW